MKVVIAERKTETILLNYRSTAFSDEWRLLQEENDEIYTMTSAWRIPESAPDDMESITTVMLLFIGLRVNIQCHHNEQHM